MKQISTHLITPLHSGFNALILFVKEHGARFKPRHLHLKRKVAAVVFLMVFMLISQMLSSSVMARAEDDIPDSGFGIQEAMNDLIGEKDSRSKSLDGTLGERMDSFYHNATSQQIQESEVYADYQLPDITEELIDPSPKNVEIRTIEPMKPLYPRIFDLAEHYTPINETDTVLETLMDGQDNYYIHTDYFAPDGNNISTWTQGSLLPSVLDQDQGLKLNDWNGVNVDNDPTTGDVDKDIIEDLIGSFPEGSDIYVRVTVEVPLLGDLTLMNMVNFILFDLPDYLNGSHMEIEAGLKIQIRKDSFWADENLPVDVGILKGIGYEDIDSQGIEYLWIGDYNFSDVPQEFEFLAMLDTVSIHMEDLTLDALISVFTDLLSSTGNESDLYDFASFAPPYTVNFIIDNDGQDREADDDDSIESFEFLLGYDKLQRVGEAHRVVDRTYVMAKVTPADGRDVIAKQFHVKLHGKKNPITEDTDYDAVEWYSRRPVNVSLIYSEGKLNDTYVVVDVKQMPDGVLPGDDIVPNEMDRTSMRVTLKNLSTDTENFTRIHYEATGEIERIELLGFEYDRGYETGHQYNATRALVRDIPAEIIVEGNFVLKDADDPFTVFNNASLTFINGLVDDAMLALASSLYAVGIKLRSIPDALSDAAGTQGEVVVMMKDRSGAQDYLGMAELGVAYGYVSDNTIYHARYAASPISHHDYLMTYLDGGYSGVEEKVAIGLRFSGIGMVKFNGIENEKGELVDIQVELKTATTFDEKAINGPQQYAYDDVTGNMPKMEVFYLVGNGDDFQGEDYARVALSNLPDHIKITLKENLTIFDASDSRDGNQIINYVAYESLIDGQYMEFNVTHIPEYLKFMNNDTMLSVSSIQFPEDAPESEKWKTKYYIKDEDHMNLEFFISNETRDGKVVKRSMPSNYMVIYQNRDALTLNGSRGVAAVTGRFKGLKSLYYESDEGKEQIEVEIRMVNPDEENLAVQLLDESEYDGDTSLGLRGSAIIGPIPEYMHILSKKPELEKSVREPDTENIDGIVDIQILMDSVKEFGRSIVDVLMTTMDDTLIGVGMAESVDFWIEFSLFDPILETSTNVDIIANITRGKISDMYEHHPEYSESYWTRGLCLRQEILDKEEERAVFDLKAFITGLPSHGRMAWNTSGDHIYLETTLSDFNPGSDWVVIDAKGIGDVDILLHARGLTSPMEMSFVYESTINATEGTINADIHSSVTSRDQPVGVGEMFAAVWSNASEYTRMSLAIPRVPSSVDLSLELNNSVHLDYTASEGMDYVLMDMKMGDIRQLEERSYWTHGVVLRNGTDDNGHHIMDMKMYMEGIPDKAVVNVEKRGDDTHVDLSVNKWKPTKDWVLLDLKGLNDTDILLYQNLKSTKALDLDVALNLTAPESGTEVIAHVASDASRDMGGIYLKFRAYGIESPVILQLYLSEVPKKVKTDLTIKNGISALFSASGDIDHLLVRVHRMVDGEWYHLTLMLHDIPDFLKAELGQNTDFDPERSVILQGNPDIRFQCSRDGMDVYLDMDGGVNGAYGHTLLQVGDLTNNTELILTEPDVYSINSPDGVGYAYLVLTDLPILKVFSMKELYIYAEDVRSVDIHVRQLFGLYPVFKLSNADGGRIHVKLKMEVGSNGKTIPLEAGVLDVKYRTIPFLAPLFVNDISTTLSTDHFIIPEPVTTVVATILAIIRGVGN